MYQHEGPVLSVCWNKVAEAVLFLILHSRHFRRATKYFLEGPTMPDACLTLQLDKQLKSRSMMLR
jgi:hypothetical protein